MTTIEMHKKEEHFKASFFKSATMAIAFFQAVSLTQNVHAINTETEVKQEPSFIMQKIGYTPVVESIKYPTFSVSSNPIKELTHMGVRQRIKIPLRQEKVAAPSTQIDTHVYNYEYEEPKVAIVRERISIPFRAEMKNTPTGSELI